jgi:predicted Zn-dependent protease
MISGNAFEALKNIQEVSRDARWVYGRWLLPWMVVEPIRVDAKA